MTRSDESSKCCRPCLVAAVGGGRGGKHREVPGIFSEAGRGQLHTLQALLYTLQSTPYTLLSAPYNPTIYSLHTEAYILHTTSYHYILHHTLYNIHGTLNILHPCFAPCTLHLMPWGKVNKPYKK